MISRIWHGWTRTSDADTYEGMLRAEVLPGIHRIPGYFGAYLLRREVGNEVEFVTITRFTDLDAVRAFAGEDFTRAVIHPPARELLLRFDERSVHYETILTPHEVREIASRGPTAAPAARSAPGPESARSGPPPSGP
jgi:heme-degrading monooxygenase HmoA